MQAKELKEYLLEDTDRIIKLLEKYGFHSIWVGNNEIRCATPDGTNKTAVSIKLTENLYAMSYSSEHDFKGDFFGLLQEFSDTQFLDVMRKIHNVFDLPYTAKGKEKKKLDLLKDIRKFKKGSRKTIDIGKYDRSILNKYIKKPHASMIEEAISPMVLDMFDIHVDIERDRIVFPHFSWDCDGSIVGLQARSLLSSEMCKEMNIPKYINYIKSFQKSNNLYGWSFAKENVNKEKKLIIFEGEKSTLKHFCQEKGMGYSVSIGGHEISEMQKNFIIRNTSDDTEIIIAFDKDIMKDESYLINHCRMFSKYRKTSYVYDKYNIIGEKDSPIDCGYKRWAYLLRHRINIK